MSTDRWYLAGPMSGLPCSNFPTFMKAAAQLRARGLEIVSPAELDDPETVRRSLANEPTGQTWGDFLSRDVKIIADQCTGIILLPGWNKSRGARLEAVVALLCGHKFMRYYPDSDRLVEQHPTRLSIYV